MCGSLGRVYGTNIEMGVYPKLGTERLDLIGEGDNELFRCKNELRL